MGSRDLGEAPHMYEAPSASAEPMNSRLFKPRMFFPFDLFKSESIDMRVMAHHEDFSQRHDGFTEMDPIGDDFLARKELFSGLRIEGEENEIVDRGGAVLGREWVVIDFVLRSVNIGRALNGLLSGLDGEQYAVRYYGRIGHDH